MGKGSSSTQQSGAGWTTTSPAAPAYQAYLDILNRASGVAGTPYQAFTGQEVAPVNQQQQTGVGTINQATGKVAGIGQLTPQQIQTYMSPYTQDVVNATENQFANTNAQQLSQVKGNAAVQGALGGNREAVAEGITAGQQTAAEAPVIAGLENAGYTQGLQTAEQQQGFGLTEAQALSQEGQQQIGAGTLEQQTQQAQDTQARQDYYQQQGYPFQVAQWLAAIDTGVGSQMGGTSNTTQNTTTTPGAPNPWAQAAGLGLALGSVFADRGGRITEKRAGFASGGTPYSDQFSGWVPSANITSGKGAPSVPTLSFPKATQQQGLSASQLQGIGKAGAGLGNWLSTGDSGVSASDLGSASSPLPGLDASDYAGYGSGGNYAIPMLGGFGVGNEARGGRVPRRRYANGGFADGGDPNFDHAWYDRVAEPDLAYVSSPGAKSYDVGYGTRSLEVPTTAGVGASQPAFDSVNPGDPIRLDPDADDRWRSGVNSDLNMGQTAQATQDNAPLPPEVISGRSKPAGVASDEPSDVTAYSPQDRGIAPPQVISGAPNAAAPDEDGGVGGILKGLGVHITPDMRNALLQAGFAMMASTRGGPGSFLGSLGQAGMAGVGAYEKSKELEEAQAEKNLKLQMEMEDRQLKRAQTPILPDGKLNPSWVAMKEKEAELAEKDAPSGYQRNKDGSLTFIKGGPHDPDQIAAETTARTKKGVELDSDTVDALAQRAAQGDTRALIGLGRNPTAVAQIQKRVAEIFAEQGLSHEAGAKAILANIADQAGRTTAERTQAGIAAKLAVYGRNVDNAVDVATKASQDVNRTSFVPVNKALNAWKTQTGDPKIVALGQALNTLTNEYARAIGGGHGTVHDKEQAEHFLNQALSHDQLVSIMDVMRKEVQMTKKSMPEAREEMRELYGKPSSERMKEAPAGQSNEPKVGDRKQFKQGWGVWDGKQWKPE